jgi:septal ring factor EnvC (AmiA/AmiB activator)
MQVDAQRLATEQAAQALAEEKRLTAEQSDAFERLKRAEAAVAGMTKHMLDLNQRRADAQGRIDKRVAALRPMLPVIMRMSIYPVETLLGAQLPAEDAVRGILVLRTIAREAEADARSLVEDREALDAATKAAAEVAPQLAAAEAARGNEADALAHQLAATKARREAAEQDAADAARRAAAEAARASSLRSMLRILETQRRLEEARAREDELRAERDQKETAAEAARLRQAALGRPAGVGTLAANAKPANQITPPVAGSLVRGWGDPEDGEPATGQSWQTEPGARVVAPCGGTVAFAEPFRGYGLLVIIDCGGGYHAVLAGLDQISVFPGRAVLGGDPVGTMRAAARAVPFEVPSAAASGISADAVHAAPLGAPLGASSVASPAASSAAASGASTGAPSSEPVGVPSAAASALAPSARPVAQSDAPPDAQSGAQSGAQSVAQSDAQSGAQSGAQSVAQSDAQSGAQSNTQSGASSRVSSGALPILYFELRKGGRPVNPAPWLKPSG